MRNAKTITEGKETLQKFSTLVNLKFLQCTIYEVSDISSTVNGKVFIILLKSLPFQLYKRIPSTEVNEMRKISS